MGLLTLFTSLHKAGGGATLPPVSYLKNPRNVEAVTTYDAFGFSERTGPDRVTYFARSGVDHLNGGRPFYRHYTISTDTWGAKVYWDTDTLDFRDVWGGLMDNGKVICFTSTSANNLNGGDWSSNLFYRICDPSNMSFGPRVPIAGSVALERGTAFGKITYMGSPGHYAIVLNQYDITTPGRVIIDVLTTTDYFATITPRKAYDGSIWYTESCVNYLGGGKMCIITRAENLGHLHYFESADSGVTWTDRGATNLGWYNSSDKIPFTYFHDGVLDIIFTDRDSLCMAISRNNDPAVFFGPGNAGKFNEEEIYIYNNAGSGSNPNLGYGSILKLDDGKYLQCWSREYGQLVANIWYTLDDFVTDATKPPAPAGITPGYITAGRIRLDITGLTTDYLKNTRYYLLDLSTAADFSTFAQARINTDSAPLQTFQNIRMKGPQINIYGLNASTLYYYRIKAVNKAGGSNYTTGSATTTA